MTKGLARSIARGAPLAAPTIKRIIKIPQNNPAIITVDGASGVGFGTLVLEDLPQGNILFHGGIANLTFDAPASGITATWTGNFSIGSAPTADATLNGAEVDLLPSTALTAATATVSPTTRAANATQVMLDNTDDSLEINLNMIVADAEISANGVLIAVWGEIYLSYVVLGDD